MVAILSIAANVVRGFHSLTAALTSPEAKYTHLIDNEALQDEFGRFRVWSGNLGALQKGHSSLDYRLRDSPLLADETIKLLSELETNLSHALAVVTGARLPYEELVKTVNPDADDDEDGETDDFFSEDEDEDEDENRQATAPSTELEQRFLDVVDINDNLYKHSVRIRRPTLRNRSLKAASYRPKDPESGIDILEQYAIFDLHHTKELMRSLRAPHAEELDMENDPLVDRLGRAITLRRRQFKYWKRHRDKLSASTLLDDQKLCIPERPELPPRNHTFSTFEAPPEDPVVVPPKAAVSEKTSKTMLSGTEATFHHQALDDLVDSVSVTSYATTVRDLSGRGIELPPPPKAANGEKDFECPYCFIICPARYGRGRPWRTHLLQDLQPYVCTYPECKDYNELFRSRREWSEHEGSHRKAWRCPEHPTAVYKSQAGLENHLRQEHSGTIPEYQLGTIVKIGETSTVDTREKCPICLVDSRGGGVKDNMQNHIANHLERLAAFALPITDTVEDDLSGKSSVASRGRTTTTMSSQDPDDEDVDSQGKADLEDRLQDLEIEAGDIIAQHDLFTTTLEDLPDDSGKRLHILLSNEKREMKHPATKSLHQISQEEDDDEKSSRSSGSVSYDDNEDAEGKLPLFPLLPVSDIANLRTLYRTGNLQQREQRYASVDAYNQIISLCLYDITRLSVDAIVNSANRANKVTRLMEPLNYHIHKTAGPGLLQECRQVGKMKLGHSTLTSGYNLPSSYVIHTARPQYSGSKPMKKFDLLTKCYRSSLKLALSHSLETVAFPCLGAGASGFPQRVAARIALQAVRDFLDTHGIGTFKRIIFCVFNGIDEKVYKDLLPVHFPPTHSDLEIATSPYQPSRDRLALFTQIQEVYTQVKQITADITNLSTSIPEFPPEVLPALLDISSTLQSLKTLFSTPTSTVKGLNTQMIADIDLICYVLQDICGSLAEVVEQTIHATPVSHPPNASIWEDFNAHLIRFHQLDVESLLELCQNFILVLADILQRDVTLPYELTTMRVRLASYRLKKTREGDDGVRDKFEEVLYMRDFQKGAVTPTRTDTVRLSQIPSVERLYQVGKLEPKQTSSIPDQDFNCTVCLLRDDITRIECDVICNSTDSAFSGMGTLDHTVFRKGGPAMQQECSSFGELNEGDVRVTPGYQLPARYVIHVIPPRTYRSNTKDILRKIYHEILWTAYSLKATSIAIPAIGTGVLNYPPIECASLALEEVKRFLETAKDLHYIDLYRVESITFCVFGSNDEFVYKSLLPIYFPPMPTNPNEPLKTSPLFARPEAATEPSSSSQEQQLIDNYGRVDKASLQQQNEIYVLQKAIDTKRADSTLDGLKNALETLHRQILQHYGSMEKTPPTYQRELRRLNLAVAKKELLALKQALAAQGGQTNQKENDNSLVQDIQKLDKEIKELEAQENSIAPTTLSSGESPSDDKQHEPVAEPNVSTIHHPRPTTPDHTQGHAIPTAARWTKISTLLVDPKVLKEANEEYEERGEDVIVHRMLTRDEIRQFAERTTEKYRPE